MCPNPSLAILILGIDYFPIKYCTVVTHILLAARLFILKHWKSQWAPNVSETMSMIKTQYSFERIVALPSNVSLAFNSLWKDL